MPLHWSAWDCCKCDHNPAIRMSYAIYECSEYNSNNLNFKVMLLIKKYQHFSYKRKLIQEAWEGFLEGL